MNYITDKIKTAVSLSEAIESYTGERLKKNKMCCPLHNEKTASFKVYPNNTFYCFGCGAGGDVIKFVQLYFDIDYQEAIKRLDTDYHLGLLKTPTLSEYRQRQQEIEKRKAEREQRIRQEHELNVKYWKAFDRVLQYEQAIKLYRPTSPEDEPHPYFISALQNIEYARYLLECAEIERRIFTK